MPKRILRRDQEILESELVETMIAGLHQFRPDLNYPESVSDMQACARAVIRMFHVKRAPLANELEYVEIP